MILERLLSVLPQSTTSPRVGASCSGMTLLNVICALGRQCSSFTGGSWLPSCRSGAKKV